MEAAKEVLLGFHSSIQVDSKGNEPGGATTNPEAVRCRVVLPDQAMTADALRVLVQGGVAVQAWIPVHQTLEDWYLQLSAPGNEETNANATKFNRDSVTNPNHDQA